MGDKLSSANPKTESIRHDASHESSQETGYSVKPKRRRLDRWLDRLVRASGSDTVFLTICAILLGWALIGIPYHTNIDWQVSISDMQAILSYLFDSLLMRQQLNSYNEALHVTIVLRSRAASHERMLRRLAADLTPEQLAAIAHRASHGIDDPTDRLLPTESSFGRILSHISNALGHIAFITFYWAMIVLWLSFGPKNQWSSTWQLYINSATSALMVFVFCFLANIRERHSNYTACCLDVIYTADAALERKLRAVTGDKLPNDVVVIPPQHINVLQRAIYYYADLVGTLVGVVLLIIVIIVWLAIGPLLKFSDTWYVMSCRVHNTPTLQLLARSVQPLSPFQPSHTPRSPTDMAPLHLGGSLSGPTLASSV